MSDRMLTQSRAWELLGELASRSADDRRSALAQLLELRRECGLDLAPARLALEMIDSSDPCAECRTLARCTLGMIEHNEVVRYVDFAEPSKESRCVS